MVWVKDSKRTQNIIHTVQSAQPVANIDVQTSAKKTRFPWQKPAVHVAGEEDFCSLDVSLFDQGQKAHLDRYEAARPDDNPGVRGTSGPNRLEWQSTSPLITALNLRAQQHRRIEQKMFRDQVSAQQGHAQRGHFVHPQQPIPPVPPLPEQYARVPTIKF